MNNLLHEALKRDFDYQYKEVYEGRKLCIVGGVLKLSKKIIININSQLNNLTQYNSIEESEKESLNIFSFVDTNLVDIDNININLKSDKSEVYLGISNKERSNDIMHCYLQDIPININLISINNKPIIRSITIRFSSESDNIFDVNVEISGIDIQDLNFSKSDKNNLKKLSLYLNDVSINKLRLSVNGSFISSDISHEDNWIYLVKNLNKIIINKMRGFDKEDSVSDKIKSQLENLL